MTGFGLKKADKLLNRSDFVALRSGKSVSDRYFIVAFRPGVMERTRLGVTVTRKVGCAVIRNRIKRIVREFYRLNRKRIRGAWDINVIAKHGAAQMKTDRAFASLAALMDRIRGD